MRDFKGLGCYAGKSDRKSLDSPSCRGIKTHYLG